MFASSQPKNIRAVIHGAWRRRFWIIVPLIIMTPLSVVAALYLPQKFVARSLILFQESDPQNPLARASSSVSERMQDRIAGMRALLKSDSVMLKIIALEPDSASISRAQRSLRIGILQSQLDLDNVGNNLLEFRLSSSRADGLGNKLDQIVRTFLEAYAAASPYNTPDRIVTIDQASDPTHPVRSRFIILATGIAGALLIGTAIAVFLETVDDSIRDPRDLDGLVAAPIIATIPELRWADQREALAKPAPLG